MKFFSIILSTFIMLSVSSCKTNNQLTKEEKDLINAHNAAFRVLLSTNEQDSTFLRKKCYDLDFKHDKETIYKLISRLKLTLEFENGVGIAAPQVGIARNLFLFIRIDKPDMPIEAAINPRIVNHPEETVCFENDGCLSIPGQSGNSIRYPWIEVEYTNEAGVLVQERLEGYSRSGNFAAVIFQHEYDHLQGILFTDKLCDL